MKSEIRIAAFIGTSVTQKFHFNFKTDLSRYLTFLLVWISFGELWSQKLTVLDLATGQPIEMATLISESDKTYGTTNAKGQVDISEFKGLELIEISSMGYKTLVVSYTGLKIKAYTIYLEPSNISLEEIVVSASGWRQTTNEVPQKIVSISAKNAALHNPQTAADLLSLSGKVFVQKSQQGGGSPMIRGFATNRLLYTVDGVRMNTAIFRGGNIQNVINLDPFATENTEVLFGPGSVKYGSDAIGGVMSFSTLSPQLSLEDEVLVKGKAVLRYATANQERTGHFDVNVGWKKWALVTSVSHWNYGELRQGKYGPDEYIKNYYVERQGGSDVLVKQDDSLLQIPSGFSQVNVMQKIRFRPNETWDFKYGFHFSETSEYGRYDRHNRMRNGLPQYAEWNYGPQSWLMHNLNITHSKKNAFYDKATLILALQSFAESRISRDFNDPARTTRTEDVQAYSANLDMVRTTSSRNALFYGVEWVLNDVTSGGVINNIETGAEQAAASRYPQSSWGSMAVYLNDEFDWTEKVTFQTGLRYSLFRLDAEFDNSFYLLPFTTASQKNDALTGSIGMVIRPGKDWVISTNFGTAFRSPNVDDIGKVFDSEPGAVVVPNPNLQAEYAYNFDLGIAKVIREMFKLDVAAFYTILNNALVRRDYQLNGEDSIVYDGSLSQVQALQNAARSQVYGLQLGIEIDLPAHLFLSSDINLQVGQEELADGSISPSRHAAPVFGVSRLSYRHQKLEIQIYSEYQAERSFEDLAVEERSKDEIYAKDENGNNFSPSWYTLNLKSSYQLSKVLHLSAGLENITNQRYRPYSSGISGAGINFILGLTARF